MKKKPKNETEKILNINNILMSISKFSFLGKWSSKLSQVNFIFKNK